jgi:hypothetical protein
MAIQTARTLVQHLKSPDFELGSALEHLMQTPIFSPIHGFLITKFPVWELGYLLDENWLHEDALNALLELVYLRHHALATLRSHPTIQQPNSLILPTSFLSDAQHVYSTQSREFTFEMLNLRERFRHTEIVHVAIPSIAGNHFVGYIYRPGTSTIQHADSLGGAPEPDVLPILQWIFAGVHEIPIMRIESIDVAQQGGGNGGNGSCGFATFNSLERSIDPSISPWNGPMSTVFRNSALEDLILYSYIARAFNSSFLEPVFDGITSSDKDSKHKTYGFTGFNDFNMFKPSVCSSIPCTFRKDLTVKINAGHS